MIRKPLIAALSFIVITFVLAPFWHINLFGIQYKETGLYVGEPNYLIGFLTVIIQAIVLSFGFNYLFLRVKKPVFKYVLWIGIFLWSMQVLAIIAKKNMDNALWFFIMESLFIVIQLGLFSVALQLIYKKK